MKKFWIVDGHCDSLSFYMMGERSLSTSEEGGQWDLIRAEQGGIGLQFLAAFIESEHKPLQAVRRGLQLIEAAHRFILENDDKVFLIKSKRDLERVPDEHKIGFLLSIEGGEILGEDLFMLNIIYELGVRAMGLTWNQRNAIGDGAGEYRTGSKLTSFGEKVISRMNELGMIIDVSHLNEKGFWHVLELSQTPVIASHSCSSALRPHPRNLTDDQLKALGKKGGVIGVNFYPKFLAESGSASRADIVRHITHIVEVAGIEAVGLGSDFDGISEVPEGMEHAGKYQELVDDLIKAGFSSLDIERIFHENFIRFLSNVIQ